MADARTILLKLLGEETVSRAAKKAADGLEDLGDEVDSTKRDFSGLDKALEKSRKEMVEFQRQAAKTGDIDMRRAAQRASRDVKQWDALKKSLAAAGEDGAVGFAARFSARVGPLMARLPISPHMLAALSAGVAAAAPTVVALVGAAISGGAALGAVGIGAALVAQNAEVKAAGTKLGQTFMASMRADASPMIRPVLDGLDMLDDRLDKLRPAFRDIFSDAARYAPTLFDAAGESVETLVEDFRAIVDNAEPVVDVLGYQIPRAVGTLSGTLKKLSEDSENSAAALNATMNTLNLGITVAGNSFSFLNKILPLTSGAAIFTANSLGQQEEKTRAATDANWTFAGSLEAGQKQASIFAGQVRSLDQILQDFADQTNAAFNAETRFGEVLDEATSKAYRNKAGMDINTEAGRKNRGMLGNLAAATRDAAAAAAAQAGGQARANGIMANGYAAFIKAARGMGIGEQAARELAAALGLIPRSITTTYTFKRREIVTPEGARVTGPGGSGVIPRAGGGPVGPGQTYMVGEDGPELVRFSGTGEVIPADQTKAAMNRRPASTPTSGGVTVVLNASVIGSRQELQDWLAHGIDDLKRRGRL